MQVCNYIPYWQISVILDPACNLFDLPAHSLPNGLHLRTELPGIFPGGRAVEGEPQKVKGLRLASAFCSSGFLLVDVILSKPPEFDHPRLLFGKGKTVFLKALFQFPVEAPCIIFVPKGRNEIVSIADQCCLSSELSAPIVP